jgi:hypothetical protein
LDPKVGRFGDYGSGDHDMVDLYTDNYDLKGIHVGDGAADDTVARNAGNQFDPYAG